MVARIVALLVLLMFFAAACGTMKPKTVEPPQNPQSIVDERVAIMKSFVGGLGASSQAIQGKVKAVDARAKLATARQGLERVRDLFVPGTALGDRGVTQSRALATIFADRSDFDAKFDELSEAFAAIDGALEGNAKVASPAVQRAKNACLSCHSRYRTPDEP